MKTFKKLIFLLLATFISNLPAMAAGTMPTASTADNPVWYIVKFLNGGCVLEAKTAGTQVATAAMTGSNEQLWRFEGSNSTGFTIVSKSGLTLYTTTAQKEGMFAATKSPSGNKKFVIQNCTRAGYEGGFLISPNGNKSLYMNQWGGAGNGRPLGLWNAVDDNCPLTFVSETEFQAELAKASLPLIPMPTTLTIDEGKAPMASFTTIAYPAEEYKVLAQQFAEFLGTVSGKTLTTVLDPNAIGAGIISLRVNESVQAEAYTLKVAADGSALVEASAAHGLFNGLTTLRQLFYDAKFNNEGKVQCITASDSPRFEYRGFMLDIARHYFDKAEVKKLLDVMALYKINKFHWHLTDDQGWRIEIPEYPLLTEIGAIRSRSLTKTTNPKFYDDTEYGRGMFYTLADLKEIVDYATKLHIDILPEVDLPGHMVAAVASYPEDFSCNPAQGIDAENKNKYNVRVDLGISKDVLNVSKPEVMKFLKCVLGHVAEVFPYPIIHIGGDECPKDAWNLRISSGDKAFKTWMTENHLSSADDIQPWLVNELGQWLLKEHGKEVVCWNELTKHWKDNFATRPIIMCYNEDGKKYMREAIDKGLRTIYTGCFPFYLDMYQTYNPVNGNINDPANHTFDDPYTGGYGNNTLQRIYEATPTSSIAGSEDMCLGVGANLWTESCNNNREAEYQFFPRILALSEVGWLPQQDKSWVSFKKRVQTHFRVFDEMGVNYATYDKDEDENEDKNLIEAQRLLADAQPDAIGYPTAGTYENLRKAVAEYNNDKEKTESLHKAIADFKAAPITQPVSGKTYRIVSASVAWSYDYAGSTMYVTADQKKLRFHYTPQTEPEELFRFNEVSSGGYQIVSRLGDRKVYLGTLGNQASASGSATTVRVDAPRVASTSPVYYDYVPGMVIISAKSGYTPDGANTRRLNAYLDGYVYAKSDATVGHTGCWRIVEVTDWAAELQALADKCERLGILADEIVAPIHQLLATGVAVSEADYDIYAARYAEHLGAKYTPAGVKSLTQMPSFPVKSYDLQGRLTTKTAGVTINEGKKVLSDICF